MLATFIALILNMQGVEITRVVRARICKSTTQLQAYVTSVSRLPLIKTKSDSFIQYIIDIFKFIVERQITKVIFSYLSVHDTEGQSLPLATWRHLRCCR